MDNPSISEYNLCYIFLLETMFNYANNKELFFSPRLKMMYEATISDY